MHTRINLAVGQYLLPIWIPLFSPSPAILLSFPRHPPFLRAVPPVVQVRSNQPGHSNRPNWFRRRFPMSRREFDRFLPLIPIAGYHPPALLQGRCVRAGFPNHARTSYVTRPGYALRERIINIDTLHEVSAITDNVCLLIIAEKCMIYVARRYHGCARGK